jgi:hypothetical protein
MTKQSLYRKVSARLHDRAIFEQNDPTVVMKYFCQEI